MRKLLTFSIALGAIVFAVVSPVLAQFNGCGAGFCQGGRGGFGTPGFTSSSGAVPWTPLNLGSALVAWWDPQNTANIALSGSNVTSWTDKVGGLAATQANGGSQPTWSATARNGTAGLTFSGSQILTFSPTGFPIGSAAGTIAVAAISTSAPPAEAFAFTQGLFSISAGQHRVIGQESSGVPLFATVGSGGTLDDIVTWTSVDRFVVSQLSGQSAQINTDGNAAVTATLTPTTNTQGTNGSIGMWTLFGTGWIGVIQQIVVTNITLDTNQRQCLEGWESWYDGKAGSNLPGGHPYKSAAPTTANNCS